MSTEFNAEVQQAYQTRMNDLNYSSSRICQPHAQDLPDEPYSPCYEIPYDKYQESLDWMTKSFFDNLNTTETWMSEKYRSWPRYNLTIVDQSLAPLSASTELYHGLSEVEVPPARPATSQCDPWCSAAMNRQVHFSDMPSRDHALAKCGVIFLNDENFSSHILITCRQTS